jgi:guanylate kinase
LLERLRNRATDSLEKIEERIAKAQQELQYEPYFDVTIVNDSLPEAIREAMAVTDRFLFSENVL